MRTLCKSIICSFCCIMALLAVDCVVSRWNCTGLSIGLCDGMFSNITIMFCIGDQEITIVFCGGDLDTEAVIILEFQKMLSI